MLFPNLKLKTYAFVGPSGTGKSYRAQYVANESGIKYIIKYKKKEVNKMKITVAGVGYVGLSLAVISRVWEDRGN